MLFRALKKRLSRLWRGTPDVSLEQFVRYVREFELYEVVRKGGEYGLEVADSYVTFREEGMPPDEAKEAALREWDL